MGDFGGKAPPNKGGGDKKSGGGFWDFVGDVLKNVNVSFNVGAGKPGRDGGGSSRNPTDPEERMQPVHAERKKAYEETIYRKTHGATGIVSSLDTSTKPKISLASSSSLAPSSSYGVFEMRSS